MSRKLFRLIVPALTEFNPYKKTASETTSLGAILIASAVNKQTDWEVEVIDENNCQNRPHLLINDSDGYIDHLALQVFRPATIVGFCATLSSTIPRVFQVAKTYQACGVFTIAGGHHVSALPKEALYNSIDVVTIGNGETAIVQVLEAYDSLWQKLNSLDLCDRPDRRFYIVNKHIMGESSDYKSVRNAFREAFWPISNIAFNNNNVLVITPHEDLKHKCQADPLPDFSLLQYVKLKVYPVNWRRGCNLHCEYCAVKEQPVPAKAEELLETVRHCHEKFGAQKFFIVDDNFGGNLNKQSERLELLKALNMLVAYQGEIGKRLSFSIQSRLPVSDDYQLLHLMRLAGVSQVRISYALPIDEDLAVIAQSLIDKCYTAKAMVDWTKKWHDLGFLVHGMFMLGYPEKPQTLTELSSELYQKEQLSNDARKVISIASNAEQACRLDKLPTIADCAKRFLDFAKSAWINTLQITLPVPIPGTDLRERLEKEGRIFPLSEIGWEYYDGQFPLFMPNNCTPEELQASAKSIKSGFYGLRHFFRGLADLIFHFPQTDLLADHISFICESSRHHSSAAVVQRVFSEKLKRAQQALKK
jgi:radical SAM superfamily enzyme YgiQ (UPF0313 family)